MSEIKNLINITDFTVEEIDELIRVADDIVENHAAYEDICAHKKLATLFFEPSTRTRLSFEAAMLELGGSVLDSPKPAPAPRQRVKASATPSEPSAATRTSSL